MLRSALPVTRWTSSNWSAVTGPVCPTRLRCTCPLRRSHSRTMPSAVPHANAASNTWIAPTKSAVASMARPVGRHSLLLVVVEVAWAAAHSTSSVCTHRPLTRSHCLSVLSAEPETSVSPLKCSAVTSSTCDASEKSGTSCMIVGLPSSQRPSRHLLPLRRPRLPSC
jgi:hypothetical protein